MIYKVLTIFIIFFILIINCQYEDSFSSMLGKDLIKRLDLSSDWDRAQGIILDVTSEVPPSTGSVVYYLSVPNLVSYDTFEDSTTGSDFGSWWVPTNVPAIYTVITGTEMYGNKYLHLSLDRSSVAQYFYHVFTSDATNDYVFTFDYYHISDKSGNIQLSFGENTDDDIKASIELVSDIKTKARFDISTFKASANFQIRFGYAINGPDSESYEIYIDNVALFLKSNHSISKQLYIVDSDEIKIDDGTGESFYEGIYKLEIYAKKGTSEKLTLKLGGEYKTFTLTDTWKKYSLETQILKEHGYLIIEIMPTSFSEVQRFPGGIYITRPGLYFMYN